MCPGSPGVILHYRSPIQSENVLDDHSRLVRVDYRRQITFVLAPLGLHLAIEK